VAFGESDEEDFSWESELSGLSDDELEAKGIFVEEGAQSDNIVRITPVLSSELMM
jgi:hypothetical protein